MKQTKINNLNDNNFQQNIAMVSSSSDAVDFGLCFHILKLNCGPGCVREDNCYFNLPPCGAPVTTGRLGSDPANINRTGCCSAGAPFHASPPRGVAYITHSPCTAPQSSLSHRPHKNLLTPPAPPPNWGAGMARQQWV